VPDPDPQFQRFLSRLLHEQLKLVLVDTSERPVVASEAKNRVATASSPVKRLACRLASNRQGFGRSLRRRPADLRRSAPVQPAAEAGQQGADHAGGLVEQVELVLERAGAMLAPNSRSAAAIVS
jgi:hypothetical protein